MSSPNDRNGKQADRPLCLDVSPERLEGLSPSQLADEMEQALEIMTEETYDPEVISAYLDALDRRAPVPQHPDAGAAYAALQQKLSPFSPDDGGKDTAPKPTARTGRARGIWRRAMLAALVAALLLGGIATAQADGLDLFRALASWTESLFSFGTVEETDGQHQLSRQSGASEGDGAPQQVTEVPEEFQELQAELERRGLPMYVPKIPEGFEVDTKVLYVFPRSNNVSFSISYRCGDDYIGFNLIQDDNRPIATYEKDYYKVGSYILDDIEYYVFNNNKNFVIAWNVGILEYSVTSNLSQEEIKEIV